MRFFFCILFPPTQKLHRGRCRRVGIYQRWQREKLSPFLIYHVISSYIYIHVLLVSVRLLYAVRDAIMTLSFAENYDDVYTHIATVRQNKFGYNSAYALLSYARASSKSGNICDARWVTETFVVFLFLSIRFPNERRNEQHCLLSLKSSCMHRWPFRRTRESRFVKHIFLASLKAVFGCTRLK